MVADYGWEPNTYLFEDKLITLDTNNTAKVDGFSIFSWRAELLGLILFLLNTTQSSISLLLFHIKILTRETNSVALCNKVAGFPR